jgi:3-oxoacyl-[acyl-carrier protein] reductase
MNLGIENRVAVVTGAASGIGFEIVRQFLMEGAMVVMNDISSEELERAVSKLENYKTRLLAITGNAADTTFIKDMVRQTVEHFGALHIVVANAGLTIFGDFLSFVEADFRRIMELNLLGSFFLVQAASQVMASSGSGGSVILLSSVVGVQAYPRMTAYAMTKAALSMMAKSLVPELSSLGIRINAVAPGATLTERTREEIDDYAGTWGGITPLGRVSNPSDIAETILFLASRKSAQITGQTIVVDGGMTAQGVYPGMFDED